MFFGCVKHNGALWMIPCNPNMVVQVNLADGTMTGYSNFPVEISAPAAEKFSGGLPDGNGNLWLIPNRASALVKLNLSTGAMTSYNNWSSGIDAQQTSKFAGGAFDSIIPLNVSLTASAETQKVTDKATDKITRGEEKFIQLLQPYWDQHEWITNLEARQITGNSEISVKRYLRKLTEKNVLEAQGENKTRKYRLNLSLTASVKSEKVTDKTTDKTTDKVTDKVTDKLTHGESKFIQLIQPYWDQHEWITNQEAREITGNSEISVKRFLRKLTEKNILEAQGENKTRKYRLSNKS